MNCPKVSVVIAVSREQPLYEESLKHQDYNNYELIPVSGQAAARARNMGVKQAQGEFIAFIDDDVILPFSWMSKGVSLLQQTKADILGGPNIITHQAPISEKLSDFLISTGIFNGFRKKFKKAETGGFLDYRNFATCNLMVRREVFARVGYFDERYEYGEDMDFLLRCQMKQVRLYYSPDFFLCHKRRSFPFAHMRQLFFWGYANMQLAFNYRFILKRLDIWGALILYPACVTLLYIYFLPTLIMGIILFPIAVHFLSYALGVIRGLFVFFIGRRQC